MKPSNGRFTLSFVLAAALAPAAPIRADEKAELARLQGSWNVESIVDRGEAVPADKIADFVMTFDEKKLIWKVDKETERSFSFVVRPDAKPKEIDLKDEEKSTSAIYEVDGDTLKLCLPPRGSMDRPKEFSGSAEKKTTLIIAKRAK